MPSTSQIVFLKRAGTFKLSDDLEQFGYDEKKKQFYVKFRQGQNTLYYNPNNVDVAKFTRQLEPPFRIKRKSDGEIFNHILGVRLFEGKSNIAYRIIFENGKAKNYPAKYLDIEEHIDNKHSINVWEYLNEVAKYNVISIDDSNSICLADKYKKLEFVTKNSLLEAYLNTSKYSEDKRKPSAPIFPFGCNRSQYQAVRNALEHNLSVIQGPPGTGKTQTILNILSNLLIAGKTVEIVSNNNSAVENVKDKLEHAGLDFLCAQLGRTSNVKTFVENQTGEYPDFKSWKLENAEATRKTAIRLSQEMQGLYKCQEDLAICLENLEEYRRQIKLFPGKIAHSRKYSMGFLHRYILLCQRDFEKRHRLSWITRLRLHWHRLPAEDNIIDILQYLLIESKIELFESNKISLETRTKDIDAKNAQLCNLSMMILKDYLYRKYESRVNRTVFAADELKSKSRDFLKEYPVVLSTTFSATSNINPAYRYNYLIMDEASQVDIAAGALALSCANNAVIVGDLKQLPNVVDAKTEETVSAIFAKYTIDESYRYSTNSFLSSICNLYPQIAQTLLREHYRCNPLIIGFCSKQFYDGEIIPMKKDCCIYPPIRVVRTVQGNHARGALNIRQIDTIVKEIIPELEKEYTDIGIIAPYNKQVEALRGALESSGRDYVTATVHKFQGREKDAIILSTVDNQIKEFTDDPHLLNVAVSRAKKQFTLVVSANEQPDTNIQNLIDYIEYYQGNAQRSQISSIFDLLYRENTTELLHFYETHKRVSRFDSENLTYWAIRKVLETFKHLDVLMHYPLRHLITPESGLTEEQRTYASHPWTHLDFIIYDTVSHKAKLAIEVDGTRYHKKESVQGKRDRIKDSVLSIIGLPLLRLSTDGSQEIEKISQAFKRLL